MTTKQIEKYKKLGWQFGTDQNISYHNGDIDDELTAKSPRIDEFFSVASSRHSYPKWEDVREKDMLDQEANIFAHKIWEKNEWDIEIQVTRLIKAGKKVGQIRIKL